MTKSITNATELILHGLVIGACLSSAAAMAASDTANFAANTPSAKRLLEEFANATSLGKACGYREEAISQYYAKEFARLILELKYINGIFYLVHV